MFKKKMFFMFLFVGTIILAMGIGTLSASAAMSDEARQISINTAVTDSLQKENEIKYYKFELSTASKVNFSFNHSNIEKSIVYWKVTVFDSLENQVSYFESKGTDTEVKSINAYLSKGTYYIRLTNREYYYSGAEYSLTVNATENAGEYEIEKNNDRETATVISEVNKPIIGNLRVESDVDFYKITLTKPGKVSLGFNHGNLEDSIVHWKITMFDSVENDTLYYESNGTDTTGKSMNAFLDKGTYYIRVLPREYYHNNIDYTLTVNYTENTGEYEVEPNNEKAQASVAEANKPIIGNLRKDTDIDYYKLTINNSADISLGFNHGNLESSIVNWLISLYDSNDKEVLSMESKGTDTLGKSKGINLAKGVYYVRVSPRAYYHNSSDYTLIVNSKETQANDGAIKVLLNGSPIKFDQAPIIKGGRTLVPLRAIFEAMGAKVEWNDKTKTVTAVNGTIKVVMKIGNSKFTKGGAQIKLDVPPQIVNGRTMVPARAVAESFGATVQWKSETKTVTIITK